MSRPEEHALLSASSSERWLHCTPAPRLEEQFPESQSEYADEGRLAHEIAELKLHKYIEIMSQRAFNAALKKLQQNPLYREEMLHYTDEYLDYIKSIVHAFNAPPYIAAEKRLDYSAYAPEGFGTSDCTIIGGAVLHINDFKYGKGVLVSAEDNPQMKLYALGALSTYSVLFDVQLVKMAIIQPRGQGDTIKEWEITAEDLRAWGESIKPAAQAAWEGKGEFCPGDWCRFCRAKALCRARSDFHTSLEEFHQMKPPLISGGEVGGILVKARELAKWVKDLEEYALAECLKGNAIPGWKAVEGRSNRQFIDTDAAFSIVKTAGYDEALLYKREPITLTATEELLGKKKFTELLAGQVVKAPGKPALALEKDKREAITLKTTAEEDFKENGGNENG